MRSLNMLVSAYFDAAEFRAQTRQPTYMRDWIAHLDRLITLQGAGSVSHKQAVAKAEGEKY
ncbi:RhuM family protein [Salana multivorans]